MICNCLDKSTKRKGRLRKRSGKRKIHSFLTVSPVGWWVWGRSYPFEKRTVGRGSPPYSIVFIKGVSYRMRALQKPANISKFTRILVNIVDDVKRKEARDKGLKDEVLSWSVAIQSELYNLSNDRKWQIGRQVLWTDDCFSKPNIPVTNIAMLFYLSCHFTYTYSRITLYYTSHTLQCTFIYSSHDHNYRTKDSTKD